MWALKVSLQRAARRGCNHDDHGCVAATLAGILLLLQLSAYVTAVHVTSFTDLGVSDVIFTKRVLFDVRARSAVECAVRCARRDACVTATFSRQRRRSDGRRVTSCRGHDTLMTHTSATLPEEGAKALALKGPPKGES